MPIVKLLLILAFLMPSMTKLALAEENDSPALPEVLVEEQRDAGYGVRDSTALKSAGSIFEAPLSVTVIDENLIRDQKTLRLQDAIANVSGAVPGDSGASLTPYLLRGFRAEVQRNGFTQSRFLFYNIFQEELANAQRVEVLKGASSALYGNAGAGGAINVITKKPLPYFYSSAALDFGDFGLIRPSADVSAPINSAKTLLLRLSASYEDSGSFRDFIGSKRWLIAPVLAWEIRPGSTLTLEGEYLDIAEPFDSGLVAVGGGLADIPLSRNLAEPSDRDESRRGILEATLETDLGAGAAMRNILRFNSARAEQFNHTPGFLLPDDRTLSRFIVDLDFTSRIYATRNEIVLKPRFGSVSSEILLGAEYSREDFDTLARTAPGADIDIFSPEYGSVPPFGGSALPTFDITGQLDSLAVYAQSRLALPYNLHLVAGGRVDLYDQDIENEAGTRFGAFEHEERGREFSPRVGLSYQPLPWISIYSSYGESFNFLFSSGLQPDGSVLAPETSKQFEGGVKLDLWASRLASTLSVYRIDARNTPVSDPVNGALFSVQVDRQRSEGVELDLTASIAQGLRLTASYAYSDARVLEDDFFDAGLVAPGVPRHSASLWAAYTISSGALGGAGIGAGFFASEGREGDLQNTFSLGDFVRFDAAIYYERAIAGLGRAEASVHFKNITDERYIENSGSRLNVSPGAPFAILGGLRVRLGGD
ncbi:MAG: TonB-dependent siderophore receptor [Deltaproteobacteria bacterium]